MVDWRRRQGKAFENEIRCSLQYLVNEFSDFWFTRLFDAKSYYAVNPNLQAPKQPADFLVLHRGKAYFLECKSSRNKQRYGLSYVQEHQKQSLIDVEEAGAEGWILLSWRRWTHEPRQNNQCFGFRINDWLHLERDVLKINYKSASWHMITQRGTIFQRSEGIWHLEKIFWN